MKYPFAMVGEFVPTPIEAVYDSLKFQTVYMRFVVPSISMNKSPFEITGAHSRPWKSFKFEWNSNVQLYVCTSSVTLSKDLVHQLKGKRIWLSLVMKNRADPVDI